MTRRRRTRGRQAVMAASAALAMAVTGLGSADLATAGSNPLFAGVAPATSQPSTQPTPATPAATAKAKPAGKLSERELAAFRKSQGYQGDGVKDRAWLTSLRKQLGTGEFTGTKAGAGSAVASSPMSLAANTPTSGPGYSYLGWMAQRRQETSSACGKATVVEMSATVPGPSSSYLTQSAVATYLGETTSSATNITEELSALGHFVGTPNFGRSFYSARWISDPPTSAQKTQFLADLKSDIADYRTPVTAGVIEVAGGPHLVGHPNLKRIEHWVIAGGWNTNNKTVWYADSWTGYGYPIPARSWISMDTFLVAVGGWAYLW